MTQVIWLYALLLGVFLLGFISSTLWEWLVFRQKRLRIENSRITELEEIVRSLTRTTAPDAMPRVDAWPPPDYESPGVFLESEESNVRARATQPQVLQVEPPSPVRMTVNPTDGSQSARRVSPLTAVAAATAAGLVAASQSQPGTAPLQPVTTSPITMPPTTATTAAEATRVVTGEPEPAPIQTATTSPTLSPLAAGAIVAAMTAAVVAASQLESTPSSAQTVTTSPIPPPLAATAVGDTPLTAASQPEPAPASTQAVTTSSLTPEAVVAATGAVLVATGQAGPEPASAQTALASPTVAPPTGAAVTDAPLVAAGETEPAPAAVQTATAPQTTTSATVLPPTRTDVADANLAAASQAEPAATPAQTDTTPPTVSPLSAAAVAVLAATAGAIRGATNQDESAPSPAQTETTSPSASPLTTAAAADATGVTASQPEPAPVSVPAAATSTTTKPSLTRATTADADLVSTEGTEPAQAPTMSPLTAAAVATLAATAGAIHAVSNQPEPAIEPAGLSDDVAVVEEKFGTAGEIAGYDALALPADQPDPASLAGAAAQLVAADESTVLPAKIDTLVAEIEHLIDTMGTTQPTEGVSPAATAGTAAPPLLRTNALPLAESPTAQGDNETSSELDGAYSAKNLSRTEYAVVQVMQATRKTLRELRALYGKRSYGR